MYEIFKARNEFAQCLISSALLMSVTRIGGWVGAGVVGDQGAAVDVTRRGSGVADQEAGAGRPREGQRRTAEDGRIDWTQSAKQVHDLVRAVTHLVAVEEVE